MALELVSDYVVQARVLLQDQVQPYRYPDIDIVAALNMAVADLSRMRPDLVFKTLRTGSFTQYSTASPSVAVVMDQRYRQAILYYIVGFIQLRDDEDSQDARAVNFMSKFTSELLTPTA